MPALTIYDLATLPELAAIVLAALSLRRSPALRLLPWLLGIDIATDAAQRALASVYHRPKFAHYVGADRVLFHEAQAIHLLWPALVLVFAVWTFLPPRARVGGLCVAAALWLDAVIAAVRIYPGQDPETNSPVFAVAQLAVVVLGLGMAFRRLLSARRHGPAETAALILLLGELAVLFAPYASASLRGTQPIDEWPFAIVARVSVWAALAVVGSRTWRPFSSPPSQ